MLVKAMEKRTLIYWQTNFKKHLNMKFQKIYKMQALKKFLTKFMMT